MSKKKLKNELLGKTTKVNDREVYFYEKFKETPVLWKIDKNGTPLVTLIKEKRTNVKKSRNDEKKKNPTYPLIGETFKKLSSVVKWK